MCSDSVRNVELVVELAPCLVMVFDVLCMSVLLVLDGGLQVALELGVLPCFLGPWDLIALFSELLLLEQTHKARAAKAAEQ